MTHAELLIVGVPTRGFRGVLEQAKPYVHPWIPIISLSKGFESGSLLRMTEVIGQVLPGRPAVALSGPNLAREIMSGQAAASVVATEDISVATAIQSALARGVFRLYTNHDVIGCEVGGALKNVIALATGMAQGLGVGDNTRATVMARGLAEITRLGVAMGGEPATFAGLAGHGRPRRDVHQPVLSRNRTVGEELGKGRPLDEILASMNMVAEGVKTAETAHGAGRAARRRDARVRRDLPGGDRPDHGRPLVPRPAPAAGPRAGSGVGSPRWPTPISRRSRRSSSASCGWRCGWSTTPTTCGRRASSRSAATRRQSASVVSILTALYFALSASAATASAVKPHASPGLPRHPSTCSGDLDRAVPARRCARFGGLQAYPSRTKDPDPVDFSTGSVGLGAVAPLFAALAAPLRRAHFGAGRPSGRFIALIGDAELDEGNVWEAVAEDGAAAGSATSLWIVDLNRQSLDRVMPGMRAGELEALFDAAGWQVLEAKYGRRLQAAFARPGGEAPAPAHRRDDQRGVPGLVRAPTAPTLRERLIDGRSADRDDARRRCVADVTDDELPRAHRRPRRPRPRRAARRCYQACDAGHATARASSSPTRSRAGGCRSPATR